MGKQTKPNLKDSLRAWALSRSSCEPAIDAELDLAAAMWTLGLLPTEELPSLGVKALLAGRDTPSLRRLAGLSDQDRDEARELFRNILNELGKVPTKTEALRQFARSVCLQIEDGSLTPYKGARRIFNATVEASIEGFHEMDPFIYAASEYEDRPEDRAFFDNAIRAEARRLLQKWSP